MTATENPAFYLLHWLEETQASISPDAMVLGCRRFMAEYLALSRSELPPIAQMALETAERFVNGEASLDDCARVSHACWSYLDERGASSSLRTTEQCAIRAAICTLTDPAHYPNDFAEVVDWFADAADRVVDHRSERDTLVRRCFAAV